MLPYGNSPSPRTVCGLSEPVPGTTLLWPSHVKDIFSTTDGGHLHSKWHFVNRKNCSTSSFAAYHLLKKVTHFAFLSIKKCFIL